MAFKMKRGSVSLRSSSRITPITTRQSPLRQETGVPTTVSLEGEQLNVSQEGVTNASYTPATPTTGDMTNLPGSEENMSEDKWKEFEDAPCGSPNKTCENPVCKNDCGCFPNAPGCKGEGGGEGTEGNEGSTSLTMPGDNRTRNVVGQRVLRKNVGTQMSGGRKLNRLKNNANRNIRKAIRKGVAPDPRDVRILSGSQTINMDHYNAAEDVAGRGTRSIFSGEGSDGFIAANQGNGKDQKYGKELYAEAERLLAINPDQDKNSQAFADLVNKNVTANINSQEQEREGVGFDPGQYMDNATRRLIRRRGVPGGQGKIDALGGEENFKKRVRPAKVARDKRRADRKSERDAEKAIKAAERKARRDKRKEENESPTKMTVNVTRPSYKMGGFGSK